jgi:hypothetical protein
MSFNYDMLSERNADSERIIIIVFSLGIWLIFNNFVKMLTVGYLGFVFPQEDLTLLITCDTIPCHDSPANIAGDYFREGGFLTSNSLV